MAARRSSWIALLLLLIIALAAALRFWRLGELPLGLYHDEAYYGLDALALIEGDTFPRFYEGWELYAGDAHAERPAQPTRFPVFFEGNYGREPLHVYLMSLSLRFFGNTPFGVRFVSATMGTLAVFTTWLAARSLFPPRTDRPFRGELLPLLAAFSLAVLYPALHFSRFGIRAMTMLPVATVGVYAFWRGWRSSSKLWLGIAGFFVGLSLYTFAAARLFPVVFVLFGAYLLLTDRESLRRGWHGLVGATVIALFTAAPLLLFFYRYPYFFVFRMAYVANRGKGVVEGAPALTWLLNVGRVLAGLFWQGETHLRHNLPGRPYLDPVQSGLFLMGAARGVHFWRKPEYMFLLIWFLVMLLPSILSGDAPHFGRLTGAAPAAAILIAAGGVWLVELLRQQNLPHWVSPVFIVMLFATSLVMTTRDYFVRYAGHPDLARDFYLADWQLGQFLAGQPSDASLYISPHQEEMATIYFALADPDRLRSFNGADGIIPAGVPGRQVIYAIRPDDEQTLANLQAFFPDGITGEAGDGFVPFHVPAGASRVTTEEEANSAFAHLIRLAGYTVERRESRVDVTLAWESLAPTSIGYTAFVHLLDSTGTLVAQMDRPPAGYPTSDWRVGEIVMDQYHIDLPSDLPPGEYKIETGFYDPATINRLGDTVPLASLSLP